jgi:hypothetical protein
LLILAVLETVCGPEGTHPKICDDWLSLAARLSLAD